MDAARRSATLLDPHLLRVLDTDHVDGLCYVVNEWGEGVSLDRLLDDGPLAPRRAAWLVSEVGTMIAHGAPRSGVAHGRLVPENVLVDEAGSVKVIGFAVDAALHGLPGRAGSDRRGRPRRRALRRAHRQVARGLALRRPPGAAGARHGRCGRARCAPAYPGCSTRSATRCSAPTPARTTTATTPRRRSSTPSASTSATRPPSPRPRRPAHARQHQPADPPDRRAPGARLPTPRRPRPRPPPAAAGCRRRRVPDADRHLPQVPDADHGSRRRPHGPRARASRAQSRSTEPGRARRRRRCPPRPPGGRDPGRRTRLLRHIDDVDWYSSRTDAGAAAPAVRGDPRAAAVRPRPAGGPRARVPARPPRPARARHGSATGAGFWPWESDAPPPPPRPTRTPTTTTAASPAAAGCGSRHPDRARPGDPAGVLYAFNRGRDGRAPRTTTTTTSPSPSASSTAPRRADRGRRGRRLRPARRPAGGEPRPGAARHRRRPGHRVAHARRYEQNFGPAGLKHGVGLLLDLGEAQRRRRVDRHPGRQRRPPSSCSPPPGRSRPPRSTGSTSPPRATPTATTVDARPRTSRSRPATSWSG